VAVVRSETPDADHAPLDLVDQSVAFGPAVVGVELDPVGARQVAVDIARPEGFTRLAAVEDVVEGGQGGFGHRLVGGVERFEVFQRAWRPLATAAIAGSKLTLITTSTRGGAPALAAVIITVR
jgi:hypothetical protein